MIVEYTTHGSALREISLNDSIVCPHSCIVLSTGQFVVSHVGSTQHRVLVVDTNGSIVKSYGGPEGSSTGQLNSPYHLTIDTFDNVLVADCNNHKVQVLSSTLTHLYDITLSKHQLSRPYRLHLDEFNGRLYIGEPSGRLFVLDKCE